VPNAIAFDVKIHDFRLECGMLDNGLTFPLMILPTTYAAALILLIISMVCWGSWANTLKLVGERWRFELFYFDYSFGVLIASVIAAFTFGMLGADMTFQDRLLVAGHLKQFYAFLGGVIFNLANMLLVAAIGIAGLAVAFPVGIRLALVIGVVLNYLINPQGNPWLLFGGVLLVLAAVIVDACAHFARDAESGAKRKAPAARGIVLSIVSGVLMGLFYPVVEKGMGGELGLGPYAAALLFSIGVFCSTFVFNIFFMNVPLEGEPVKLNSYFLGRPRWHFLGIAGGVIWAIGAIANFAAASAPEEVNVGPAISLAMGQCATLITVLWGLLLWKEFSGTGSKVKRLVAAMLVLFSGGLLCLSLAPIITSR
jgi:glucose uptake protein